MRSGDMVKTDIRKIPCPASAIQMVRHMGLRKFLIPDGIDLILFSIDFSSLKKFRD
jgi:hypothetical protein